MKHSVFLLVVLVLSSLLIVACGGGGGDTNSFEGISNESKIKTVSLQKATDVNHKEGHSFGTAGSKLNLPANALSSNYNIEISKIDTSTLSNSDKSLLKSKLGLSSKVEFMSPVLGVDIKPTNKYDSRMSVNIAGTGVQLNTMGSITISLNNSSFDWNNFYYYVSYMSTESMTWVSTPLQSSNFGGVTNQLVINTINISNYYVVVQMPQKADSGVVSETNTNTSTSTQTQTNTNTDTSTQTQTQTATDTSTDTCLITGFSLRAEPDELIASQTTDGKFAEDMEIGVGLGYTGNNPFVYTTPTIEFLAFKPFDLGNSVKSTYENGVYSYTYNRFSIPESDFANWASFTLTLPTKGVSYDADKFPENIFVTAKFKSKDNKDYQTSPASIAFKNSKQPQIAKIQAQTDFYNNDSVGLIYIEERENTKIISNDAFIQGYLAYENATPSFDVTPIYFEIMSESPFEFEPLCGYWDYSDSSRKYVPINPENPLASSVYDSSLNMYTCKIKMPAKYIDYLSYNDFEWLSKDRFENGITVASFSLYLIASETIYDPQKIPEELYVKICCDGKESNTCIYRIENEFEISQLNLFCNEMKPTVVIATGTKRFTNDLIFEASVGFKGEYYSLANKSVKLELLANSPFYLAGVATGTFYNNHYSCEIDFANYRLVNNNVASFVLTIPLKNTLYDKANYPDHIIARAKSDNKVSDPICISFVYNETLPPAPTCFTAGGTGTEDDPFLIATAEDLDNIRHYPDYYYKQVADIDLYEYIEEHYIVENYWENYSENAAGYYYSGWLPIDNFSKTYDGNNHIINGLWIDRNQNGVGLFGILTEGANLKNIIIKDSDVGGIDYVGFIVGIASNNNVIDNCHVEYSAATGSVCVGGIAGIADTITNCSTNITIKGQYNVGGIVGKGKNITNCYARINVCYGYSSWDGGIAYFNNLGGIAGTCESGCIDNCLVSDSEIMGVGYIGGIVAEAMGTKVTINNCIFNNRLNRYFFENHKSAVLGGIVGKTHTQLDISNCLVIDDLSYVADLEMQYGGIIGENTRNSEIIINNCNVLINSNFNNVDSHLIMYSDIGYIGYHSHEFPQPKVYCWQPYNSYNVTEITKSDFWGASTQSTFWANPDKLGWDFDNVWEFRSGYNLPQLKGLPSVEDPTYIE